MRIDRMLFANFPPFAPGGIVFPEVPERTGAEVHLLVGENGTGKTRLLSLLLNALGNQAEIKTRVDEPEHLLAFVSASLPNETISFFSRSRLFFTSSHFPTKSDLQRHVGFSLETIPKRLPLFPDTTDSPLRRIGVKGFCNHDAAANRPIALCYKGIASISDAKVSSMKAVASRPVSDDLVFHKDPQESDEVGQLMVNLKLAAAMDLLQNNERGRNIRLTNRLETTISQITGKKFSFRVVDHPKVELRVDWGTKKQMRISQLPDGLRSIIGWLVSCCARLSMHLPDDPNPLDHPFVLVLDEPEGNLHPAWQRKVLPAARKLFKNAQIIAATHSPWVVSSVNEGFIHVLRFNSDEQVTVDPPKPCEKGDSYIDVVEDVLGVKEWFDPETEALLAEFRDLVSKGGPAGEIERLAAEIGGRGEYLAALVGREMAGFRRKSQQPKGA